MELKELIAAADKLCSDNGHEMDDWETDPEIVEKGEWTFTICKKCGYSATADISQPKPHGMATENKCEPYDGRYERDDEL